MSQPRSTTPSTTSNSPPRTSKDEGILRELSAGISRSGDRITSASTRITPGLTADSARANRSFPKRRRSAYCSLLAGSESHTEDAIIAAGGSIDVPTFDFPGGRASTSPTDARQCARRLVGIAHSGNQRPRVSHRGTSGQIQVRQCFLLTLLPDPVPAVSH